MIIQFHLHYKTQLDERLILNISSDGNAKYNKIQLQTYDGENWTYCLNIKKAGEISYKYSCESNSNIKEEFGEYRKLNLPWAEATYFVNDAWKADGLLTNIFHSSAFKDIIFRREATPLNASQHFTKNAILFRADIQNIPQNYSLGIVGNPTFMGGWVTPLIMAYNNATWEYVMEVDENTAAFEYKFVLVHNETKDILEWEKGENRKCIFTYPDETDNVLVINSNEPNFESLLWRGAGIAIPVFSLRSKNSFGIGEYPDLKLMIDFAKKSRLNIVQVLPVNDTIANRTWMDSYPYAAISVFALNPLYINIDNIAPFKDKKLQKAYEKEKIDFNAYSDIQFLEVSNNKFKYFKILFDQEKDQLIKSDDFKKFLIENQSWLPQYALFSVLRDENNTPNFNLWKKHTLYSDKLINEYCTEGSKYYDDILFYYFLQYHAEKQLVEARNYGKVNEIVLKGDLPIGIYRYSCDAWIAPDLYNMNEQAGAPPDDYAEDGQNWGFPTYNWDVMAKDGFSWWRNRMKKLNQFFDALRIDHILGFFRIWQIPTNQLSGTLGTFNSRLPLSLDELNFFGININHIERYTSPYIDEQLLNYLFNHDVETVKATFLEATKYGNYKLKEFVNTQGKIKSYFEKEENKASAHFASHLSKLVEDVLLLEEPNSMGQFFNPRITLQKTYSYKMLFEREKNAIDRLYEDYFFKRHNQYWKEQALWKLPALLKATNMLICGEDLGMIPSTVPEVMKALNIIPLEIQRMPKGNVRFGNPETYNYFSVCSPSCHDMSTIRGWWESNHQTAQQFYSTHMHYAGIAPTECNAHIVKYIVKEHFDSDSILAIFPIQDLLGMNDQLKRKDTTEEQINNPSNPNQHWQYRLHINLEDLINENEFIEEIKDLVILSKRN